LPGLDPGIHVFMASCPDESYSWMAGPSPARGI
jgi:hypothetical protein